jgi:hypothetical protein
VSPSRRCARWGRLVSDRAVYPSDQLHPEYPLAQWVHLDSFDSAAECKKAGFEAEAAKANKGNFLQTEQYRAWQCIATDDPRLKRIQDS